MEWLLDNEYVVLRASDQIRVDVPAGFYRLLPKLDGGPRDTTRVEAIAREVLAASDHFIDVFQIQRFLRALQSVTALDIGEIWALPAFLRLVMVEEVVAAGIDAAAATADASANERMAVAIGSLRVLETTDWASFFESVSIVDRYLRLEPNGAYDRLDFATRDRYRRAVEELARWASLSEANVARSALQAARDSGQPLGAFLVGDERPVFERALGCRVPVRRSGVRLLRRRAGTLYFGAVTVASAAALLTMLLPAVRALDGLTLPVALVAAALALVPATAVAITLVNEAATRLVRPRRLPRLDFSGGIPDDARALVAVPAMLSDAADVTALLRQLDLNRRGNDGPNLPFALLVDPVDADVPELSEDARLLALAAEGVRALNERCRLDTGRDVFVLATRAREWNPAEGCWMAWERKRGKLEDLNDLLLGRSSRLRIVEGDPGVLEHVRYVLTLDADTFLPQGTAARLVATLAHPLNQARFDEVDRVVAGYTVLQPRVDTVADSEEPTWFSRMYQSSDGFDLYSHTVSDVYQDLFGEGIYAGKGLYDVGAFVRSLEGRVPENALLSHDLFEGVHGRVALVTDVSVVEDYPSHPVAHMERLHRWVRGDWQLLPWLLPVVPTRNGRAANRLSALDRWKVLDNLRRSLLSASLVGLVVVGWLWLPGTLWWTVLPFAVLAVPILGPAVAAARPTLWREAVFRTSLVRTGWAAARSVASVALLPWQAWVELDAIGRTLVRVLFTRRQLLQWRPAAVAARSAGRARQLRARMRRWLPVDLTGAALVAAALGVTERAAALPLATLWLMVPVVVSGLATRVPHRRRTLQRDADPRLRRLARRTWAYFDRLVAPQEHWLPPDNLQLHPVTDVAQRTSPTNIGLGMLAQLVGSDLGFVPPSGLVAVLASTLDSLDRMERHRGHLLNWYDTRQLRPLAPRYVSTVDSGNLAACAWTLREGLADLAAARLPRSEHADGVVAGLETLAETLEGFHGIASFEKAALPSVIREVASEIGAARDAPLLFAERLSGLHRVGLPSIETEVAYALEAPRSGDGGGSLGVVRDWVRDVDRQVSAMLAELGALVPWLDALNDPPRLYTTGEHEMVAAAWDELVSGAPLAPRLRDIPAACGELLARLADLDAAIEVGVPKVGYGPGKGAAMAVESNEARTWNEALRSDLRRARDAARELLRDLDTLQARLSALVEEMDFGFLYDGARKLLRIGYHVDGAALDRSYYDLYASEARIASFVAIAKGDVPAEHWVRLGRPFARRGRDTVLLSWAGTMFEYLMPSLFMRSPTGSLAEMANRRAIDAQVRHRPGAGLPWGASESGFSQTDPHQRYRYRAFGVSELSVRREPGRRAVTAPYASLLALSTEPRRVWRNLTRLEALGALGPLGFYEAVDFGSGRERRHQLVRSFMAHHQGMILAALDNYLCDDVLVRRFHRDPRVVAFEHLLSEAAPGRVRVQPPRSPAPRGLDTRPVLPPAMPKWDVDPQAFPPETTVVANGALSALLTAQGGGGLRWRGRDVLRWRPDPTSQEWGTWVYVRDIETERLWSATLAPTWAPPDRYEVRFSAHSVDFQREDDGIAMRTTVCIAPTGDVEIRRITLVNESSRPRVLELTSYAEVALADPAEDRRHPAFSKLFVEGRYASRVGTLLLERRTRGDEGRVFVAHAVATPDPDARPIAWALDRDAFLGRGGSLRAPQGVRDPLTDRGGDRVLAPLDPIASLTTRVPLPAGEEVSVAFLTAVADAPGTALAIIDACRSPERALFAVSQARDQQRALLLDLSVSGEQLPTFQKLLTAITYPYHALRGPGDPVEPRDAPRQESLWAAGVSGDLPVVLVEPGSDHDPLVDELVLAQAYWERHNVRFDLIVVDAQADGYEQPLRIHLDRVLAALGASDRLGHRGGVHYLPWGRVPERTLVGMRAAAGLHLVADGRPLAAHLEELARTRPPAPPFVPIPPPGRAQPEIEPLVRAQDLAFANEWGGFAADGAEYVMQVVEGRPTPAPWSNVLAHDRFGALVTESGGGYTWADNSGERRLTRWRNDPVLDPPSEALYLRDEETSDVWTATPAPAPARAPYRVIHRAGLTTFRHRSHGLDQRVDVFIPPGENAKVVELTLENEWKQARRITATYYAEWVLGVHRWVTGPHVSTEAHRQEGVVFARNPFSAAMGDTVAFLGASEPLHGFTCDRFEFLGPSGDASRPAGLARIGLDGREGVGLDPCAAIQVHLDLPPGGGTVVRFVLGAEQEVEAARATLARLRDPAAGADARRRAVDFWDDFLGRVTVRTPEPSMDLLLNRWLLHQTVACRLWGRSALYQSSGAIGFRDQLQDSLALRGRAAELTRHQILEGARHQFGDGDVLHWWHPDTDRGVRTRCSDDMLWLPFGVSEYVEATGDRAILDELVPFLEAPPLEPGELERYDRFAEVGRGSLFEHCLAAIQRASRRSPRGLPLIGTGDWNDALNRVGARGRGESVWLAWFLYAVQTRFAGLCEQRGDERWARALRADAERLRQSVEAHCWDGSWYQRATFDDGTPIGTHAASEGSIDSLTQSWAVLCGGARPGRVRLAMESVLRHLVRRDDRLVLLLTPPFHEAEPDPGYIRSYPPGVRENGGQYTHAATWVGLAFAELGDGDTAEEIFRLLNPILRTDTTESAHEYRVEPYVLAGDVYGAPPHLGRGGWTWYTGSAGWMYRLGLEGILGVVPAAGGVEIRPCIPRHWKEYQVALRVGPATTYRFAVRNPHGASTGVAAVRLDGRTLRRAFVPLADDGVEHEVDVELGVPDTPADPDAEYARSDTGAGLLDRAP